MSADLITLSDFRSQVIALIWPDGEPENLTNTIKQFVADCLIDLQRFIPCLQENHVDISPFSACFFKCGLSVIDAPRGRIKKVYTVQKKIDGTAPDQTWDANDNFCAPVQYHPRNIEALRCWSRRFMDIVSAPANLGMPPLPLGFKYPEATTDSTWGRALRGLWAVERKKLFISPWIQSTESIVVEWEGLKRKWADTDLVPDEDDLRRAVKLFVQSEFTRDFQSDAAGAAVFYSQYREQYSDLAYECDLERRTKKDEICDAEVQSLSWHQFEDDIVAPVEIEGGQTVFAVIGDWGLAGQPQRDVAALVKSWDPEFVVSTGDTNYPNGEVATLDANTGIYRKFIFPYQGTYPLQTGETDATENLFFSCIGNHDEDNSSGQPAQPFMDWFSSPGINERYFDFSSGFVHCFILHSGFKTNGNLTEPDGNNSFSIQAEWLQIRLALSTARWKLVFLHHSPFTSDVQHSPGESVLRWNYPALGADAVFSSHGHNSERFEKSGFPYIVNGCGGGDLRGFEPIPEPDSVFRMSGVYSALRIVADCASCTVECVDTAGVVRDTRVLS
jgi:hypothetical protein